MPDTLNIRQSETLKVGKRGTIVVPAKLRRTFGINDGDLMIAEQREDGILLRPAAAYAVEIYTPERKAEFILGSATDEEDYQAARAFVRQELRIDPETVDHFPPRPR